jgi:hypothetical protein
VVFSGFKFFNPAHTPKVGVLVALKVTVKVEADIPNTLLRYGKMRVPPIIMSIVQKKGGKISMKFEGEPLSLKIDKYGRISLPPNVLEKARGKDKLFIESVDGDVRIYFQ